MFHIQIDFAFLLVLPYPLQLCMRYYVSFVLFQSYEVFVALQPEDRRRAEIARYFNYFNWEKLLS